MGKGPMRTGKAVGRTLVLCALAACGLVSASPPEQGAVVAMTGIPVRFEHRLPSLPTGDASVHLLIRLAAGAPADAAARLAAGGAVLAPAGTPSVWYATVSRVAAARLLDPGWVAGVALPPPGLKLAAPLRQAGPGTAAVVNVWILFHADVSAAAALTVIQRAVPGSRPAYDPPFSRAAVALPARDLVKLAGFEEVFQIWPAPPPRQTENIDSRDSVDMEQVALRVPGLTGHGVRLGIWDERAVRATHKDFNSRVTIQDGTSSLSLHSTHVAGTMVSSGEAGNPTLGMAPAAALWSFDFNNDLAEINTNAPFLAASNHSYGFITGWKWNFGGSGRWHWFAADANAQLDQAFGKYDVTARDFDQIVFDHDLPIFKSAGNDRTDSGAGSGGSHYHGTDTTVLKTDFHRPDGFEQGFDTMAYFTLAKNIITIGSVRDVVSDPISPGTVSMTTYSSWGPVDDGRVKPDLVANGDRVTSTAELSDTDFSSLSGTSMASPAAAGAGAVLVERATAGPRAGLKLGAAEMKGLMVHGAVDVGLAGPDYGHGWGLLNAAGALAILDGEFTKRTVVRRGTITAGSPIQALVLNTGTGQDLKATLVWIDPPAAPNTGGDDDPAPALVHDLDLLLTSPSGVIHHPWALDPANPQAAAVQTGANRVDTVEQVLVGTPDGEAGDWTVRVSLNGTLLSASQPYYLVVTFACGPNDSDCDGCALDSINDVDGDGICADWDGCPAVYDPLQRDRDLNGVGDACDGDDGLIHGVEFTTASGDMSWPGESGMDTYNVYRRSSSTTAPIDAGDCFLSGLPQPLATIAGEPAGPGQVWLLQVTGMSPGGEGPLGESRDGVLRQAAAPCP